MGLFKNKNDFVKVSKFLLLILNELLLVGALLISFTVIKKLNLQKAFSNMQQCFQHCLLQKQSSVH